MLTSTIRRDLGSANMHPGGIMSSERNESNAPHTGRDALKQAPLLQMMKRPKVQLHRTVSAGMEGAGFSERSGDVARAHGSELLALADFPSLGLDPSLCKHIALRLGWQRPTHIQARAIPALLALPLTPKNESVLPVWSLRARTGTGKTAAYLLPIIHSLLQARPRIDRSNGTLAIILAPTRELCVQVEEMAKALLRPYHWIVVSAFLGGEKRKSEKGRLRHGTSLVIGTPGRLWDHLQHTSSWQLSECKWFILDEADRLLEMGMTETAKNVWVAVRERSTCALSLSPCSGSGVWEPSQTPFRTVLVSATMRDSVASLLWQTSDGNGAPASACPPEIALESIEDDRSPEFVPSSAENASLNASQPRSGEKMVAVHSSGASRSFSVPTIAHYYVLIPTRFRLAGLAALLRGFGHHGFGLRSSADSLLPCNGDSVIASKALVFFSTCAAVDFHFEVFRNWAIDSGTKTDSNFAASSDPKTPSNTTSRTFSRWLNCFLFRIHGSMSQVERVSTFRDFRRQRSQPCLLFCTDVAARGLDIRDLYLSVQYDPPTSDGDQEYWHRVGRTSRMGSAGVSVTMLQPHEHDYIRWMGSKYNVEWRSLSLLEIERFVSSERHLEPRDERKMPSCTETDTSEGAFDTALRPILDHIHRLIETIPALEQLAVDSFHAYVRSYRTHARDMRQIFNARLMHLGHLAESFGLGVVPRASTPSGCGKAPAPPPFRDRSSRLKRSLVSSLPAGGLELPRKRRFSGLALPNVDRRSEFMA
ncbi:ATPdependent RNA helicase [Cyanidiococcus yangmingshanensis]|uniref:ATP-dependent RNA helicase n=1 Tax=Cyanidiococcus yangmingshanensis TaxID=2690220 RepID=A0A7J7IJ77_9RHOD|nr:ATPdependent RNA helicase [Cyanidiococcus yangmingshanensis]